MSTTLDKIYSEFQKKLGKTNIFTVPKITRVVVNVGVGKQRDDKNFLSAVEKDVATITGQHPSIRRSRKAIAGFNVRQGNIVGYSVTLRGKRMEDFVRRFTEITLPRVRDFRGIPLSQMDGHGNLSFGLLDQLAFPEIHPEQTDSMFGLQVTMVTSAKNDEEGELLFRALGFPLTAEEKEVPEQTKIIKKSKTESNK